MALLDGKHWQKTKIFIVFLKNIRPSLEKRKEKKKEAGNFKK
jgi:hypothetical protein